VLGEAAREESAFRWSALTALSSMDHVHAYEALTELLHVNSAETRYGAFKSLRVRNAADPLVRGESLAGKLSLHVIAAAGEPLIHISKAERSEIVLFGQDIQMAAPQGLFAGKHIVLTSTDPEQIKLSRFDPGKEDRTAYCNTSLDQVIRAIVSLDGTYGDVVQMIHEAQKSGLIAARVAIDAVPRPGRSYYRDSDEATEEEQSDDTEDLLADTASRSKRRDDEAVGTDAQWGGDDEETSETYIDPNFTPATNKGVWSRVKDWFTWSK